MSNFFVGTGCPIQPSNITYISSTLTSITFEIQRSAQLIKNQTYSLTISYVHLQECNASSNQNVSSFKLCQNRTANNAMKRTFLANDDIYTLNDLIPNGIYQIQADFNIFSCKSLLQTRTTILMTSKSLYILLFHCISKIFCFPYAL